MRSDLRIGAEAGGIASEFLPRVLASLVATPSFNPGASEAAIAKCIAGWLDHRDIDVTLVESMPGRPSVAAVIRGSRSGPTLILNGHMDTVPIDDRGQWSVDPFAGVVRDGFLYGRGACDMKGGLAAQIGVAHAIVADAGGMAGDLVLHFAAGEERGEPGTLSLLQAGFGGDVGITTEPTELRVATATRGLAFYRILIRGQSIHASRAHLGRNPMWLLPDVLDAVAAYQQEVSVRPHPLLPGGSCTPTLLRSGVVENAVPDNCELILDRRLIPGESVQGELQDIRHRLMQRLNGRNYDVDVSVIHYPFEAAEIGVASPFARRVLDVVGRVTGEHGAACGMPFASDVRNLVNDGGVEAVTFGPGNVNEAHCADERVSLRQLEDAARVMELVAREVLIPE